MGYLMVIFYGENYVKKKRILILDPILRQSLLGIGQSQPLKMHGLYTKHDHCGSIGAPLSYPGATQSRDAKATEFP